MALPDFLSSSEFSSIVFRNILAKSQIVSSNLFRVGIVDGAAQFISNVTGRAFGTLSEAYSYTVGNRITDFAEVAESTSRGFSTNLGDPYARFSSVVQGINSEVSNMSSAQKQVLGKRLRDAGLDVDLNDPFRFQVLTMKAKKGEASDLASQVYDEISEGRIKGIPLFDDEGGRILRIISGGSRAAGGGTELTEAQANILLSSLGRTFLDPDHFGQIMQSGNVGKYFKEMSKILKRTRGDISPRDFEITNELSQELLDRVLGTKGGSISSRTLVTDPQYEMLYAWFQGKSGRKGDMVGLTDKALSQYYGSTYTVEVAENLVEELISQVNVSPGSPEYNEFHRILSSIMNDKSMTPRQATGLDDFLSDVLATRFESELQASGVNAGVKDNVRKLFSHVFEGLEKSDDGSMIVNARFLSRVRTVLEEEVSNLQNSISSGVGMLDSEQMEIMANELDQKQKLLNRIIGDFDQITVRGRMFDGTVKSAASIRELIPGLSDEVDFILSKAALKRGYGFSKEEGFVFSGFGSGGQRVYTDPVGVAFNPEMYTSEEAINSMRQNFDQITAELRQTVEDGVIPEKLRKSIDQAANQSLEFTSAQRSPSALKNRAFAQELQSLMQSGVNPRHSPKMMNMLYRFMMNQAYTGNAGEYRIAMPEVFRFALDTEEKHIFGTGLQPLLGRGYEEMDVAGTTIRLPKFRLRGKQMLMSGASVSDLFDSLGGFDLDDKGIPRMTLLDTDDGKRLAFFTLRQPQGAEEYALQIMNNDIETVQSLFGSESTFGTRFRSTLAGMIADGQSGKVSMPDLADFEGLETILSTKNVSPTATGTVDEALLVRVLEKMQSENLLSLVNISGTGSTARLFNQIVSTGGGPLTIRGSAGDADLTRKFQRFGITRLEASTENLIYNQSSRKQIEIFKELINAPEYATLNPALRQAINSADLVNAEDSMKGIFSIISSLSGEDEIMAGALTNSAYSRMTISKLTDTDNILGSYVNNSMLVGSTRSQIEDLQAAVQQAARQRGITNFQSRMINLVPMPGQEVAIDLATLLDFEGVAVSRAQMLRNLQLELQSLGLSASDIQDAAQEKILANMGFDPAEATKFYNLKDLQRAQMQALGQQMGAGEAERVILGISDEMLAPGFDPEYIARTFHKDSASARLFLENYIAGMQEASDNLSSSAMQARIEAAQQILDMDDYDSFIQEFDKFVSLSSDNERYRSFSKVQNLGREFNQYARNLYRSLVSGINDPALMSAKVSDDARALSEFIVSRHKQTLDDLYGMATEQYNALSDLDQLALTERRIRFSYQFLNEMNEAAISKNVDFEDLTIAIEKRIMNEKYSLDNLEQISGYEDEIQHVNKIQSNIIKARLKNAKRYYISQSSQISQDLASALRGTGLTNIREAAEDLMSQGTYGEDAANILRMIIGQDLELGVGRDAATGIRRLLSVQAQATRALFEEPSVIDEDIIPPSMPSGAAPPIDDQIRQIYDDLDLSGDVIDAAQGKYVRIGDKIRDGSFTKLFADPVIKKSLVGLAALVVGSFVYSGSKDRTVDNMQGPPLLPGGSAYETDMPYRSPDISQYSPVSSSAVSYKVSLMGSRQSVDRFMNSAGNMDIGRFNTTMYNTLPSMNRDLYSSFGSSF